MAKVGSLFVSLALDSARYAAGLSATTKKTNKTVRNIQRQLKGMVNFALGAGGLYALVRGFGAVTKAMAAQEEATARLSQTLRNNNEFTSRNLRGLEEQAAALQKVTRYGDELINSAQSQLMALGGLNSELVMRLTPALLDFAAGMRIDVVTAAELLGKSIGGTTNLLSRYGIQMDTTKDAAGRLAEIQQQINDKFADQSKIKGFTTSTEQLKNAVGDLSEEFGFMVAGESGGVLGAVGKAFAFVADNMKAIRENADLREEFGVNVFLPQEELVALRDAADLTEQIAANYTVVTNQLAAQKRIQNETRPGSGKSGLAGFDIQGHIIQPTVTFTTGKERKRIEEETELYRFWNELNEEQLKTERLAAKRRAALEERRPVQFDEWMEFVASQKRALDAAEDNFNDYAFAIQDTWAWAIRSMIDGNKAFAFTFENLVARPIAGALINRATNVAADNIFGYIEGLPGVSTLTNFLGRDTSGDAEKPALGGMNVVINGPSADAVIAIVENNMASNGTLRN
jgi:hypothetical protein